MQVHVSVLYVYVHVHMYIYTVVTLVLNKREYELSHTCLIRFKQYTVHVCVRVGYGQSMYILCTVDTTFTMYMQVFAR